MVRNIHPEGSRLVCWHSDRIPGPRPQPPWRPEQRMFALIDWKAFGNTVGILIGVFYRYGALSSRLNWGRLHRPCLWTYERMEIRGKLVLLPRVDWVSRLRWRRSHRRGWMPLCHEMVGRRCERWHPVWGGSRSQLLCFGSWCPIHGGWKRGGCPVVPWDAIASPWDQNRLPVVVDPMNDDRV